MTLCVQKTCTKPCNIWRKLPRPQSLAYYTQKICTSAQKYENALTQQRARKYEARERALCNGARACCSVLAPAVKQRKSCWPSGERVDSSEASISPSWRYALHKIFTWTRPLCISIIFSSLPSKIEKGERFRANCPHCPPLSVAFSSLYICVLGKMSWLFSILLMSKSENSRREN